MPVKKIIITNIKPLLKWAGGKSYLTSTIYNITKEIRFKKYIEPFFGGGAIYFNFVKNDEKIKDDAVINDINSDLMMLYKHIKNQSKELIKSHNRIKNQFNRKGYYYIRARFNGIDAKGFKKDKYKGTDRSAALMILNKTCFNGIYRVNKDNKFNVPQGRYKLPSFIDDELIYKLSNILPKTRNIKSKPYQNIEYKKGDLVYFDPPYDPINRTSSFTAYSAQFGEKEQEILCKFFKELDKRGVYVILSNNNTPRIKKLYNGYPHKIIDCSRSINSKKDKRGKIKELLIIGKSLERVMR